MKHWITLLSFIQPIITRSRSCLSYSKKTIGESTVALVASSIPHNDNDEFGPKMLHSKLKTLNPSPEAQNKSKPLNPRRCENFDQDRKGPQS